MSETAINCIGPIEYNSLVLMWLNYKPRRRKLLMTFIQRTRCFLSLLISELNNEIPTCMPLSIKTISTRTHLYFEDKSSCIL